ncbi:hypothetical protein B0I33_104109 [Prauserella shujinwangii]|uniref:Uncharacterized protein n=1 Tax=Prauserella shujinwangii TaxID=1453103 RepID=A0A2T0LW90_9PSEU|nr:hypothetical protein [Prauserella shujinwangii]PRX48295.1 hypothetical protein B0I33_104109 [Prauserella shujinwangii]
MWNWLRNLLERREPRSSSAPEADAATDPGVAKARPTGGRPDDERADNPSTTGPGETETFVGRAAGEDLGYAGETGAGARAEREHPPE